MTTRMSDYEMIQKGICPDCGEKMIVESLTAFQILDWSCMKCKIEFHLVEDPDRYKKEKKC